MAFAGNFLIGANDEHGLNPPTPGKRTPVLPYLDRSFYENQFNYRAKYAFLAACLRCGFSVLDLKPEVYDLPVSTRVARANRAGVSLLVTFAYNAFGDGSTFNNAGGFIVFYSKDSPYATQSRLLSYDLSAEIQNAITLRNRGVGTLDDVGVLESVRCPSALVENGFMTNLNEARLMVSPIFTSACGEAAAKGVCNYLDVPFVDSPYYPALMRRGSRGKDVAFLQYLLKTDGYTLTADGIFGTETERAVRLFQQNNGLSVDGIAGYNTLAYLQRDLEVYPVIRRGNRGTFVRMLQELLLSKLYDAGTVDGIFGSNTLGAVKDFQSESGLSPDGIVGPLTWAALLSPETPRV